MEKIGTINRDEIRIEYKPLSWIIEHLWKENPKLHDQQSLVASIERYGFRDAGIFDITLDAVVAGNGRNEALLWMKSNDREAPRGIKVVDGEWYVPLQFGVDSATISEAKSLALDHNNLVVAGADFTVFDISRMWEPEYVDLLKDLAQDLTFPVSVDADDVDALINGREDKKKGSASDILDAGGYTVIVGGLSEKDKNKVLEIIQGAGFSASVKAGVIRDAR